jgi:hypothetical protein
MFRVYQESVEQTRLLTDLREAVEDEDDISLLDQKSIHLEPTGKSDWTFGLGQMSNFELIFLQNIPGDDEVHSITPIQRILLNMARMEL